MNFNGKFPAENPEFADHRSRVGAARREKTRIRLIESAFLVFAQHGFDAGVIDKVIKAAGVSRGTFYNYFRTDAELFEAVATEVSNEILRIVDPAVREFPDAASRVSCGLQSVIRLARKLPLLAEFMVRGGPSSLRYGKLVTEVVPRDLLLGVETGQFTVRDLQLAFDLLLGPVNLAFHTVASGEADDHYGLNLACGILRALGVPPVQAEATCYQAQPDIRIPEDSLFARGESPA